MLKRRLLSVGTVCGMWLLVMVGLSLRTTPGASAQSLHLLQPTRVIFQTRADSTISQLNYTTNCGGSPHLYASLVGLSPDRYMQCFVAKYDVSSIPQDATVISATMQAYLYHGYNADSVPLSIRAPQPPYNWYEYQVTWRSIPAWNLYNSALVAGEPGWYSWDVTELVSAWVADRFNAGLGICGPDEGPPYERRFHSREGDIPPRLIVAYDIPATPTATASPTSTATPTPTSTILPDLRPVEIEVNQAIVHESLEPLFDPVANRQTVVRLYVSTGLPSTFDCLPNVDARLRVYDQDHQLLYTLNNFGPAREICAPSTSGPTVAAPWWHPEGSLDFELPLGATRGTILLQPEVNWDGRILETNHANNQAIARTVNFRQVDKSISVAYVRIRVRVDDPGFPRYAFASQTVQRAVDQVRDTWPLRRDWINYYEAPGLDLEWNAPLDTPDQSARFLARLSHYWYRMTPRPAHLFAWIPSDTGRAIELFGDAEQGNLGQPGRVAWAIQLPGADPYFLAKYLEQNYGFNECDYAQRGIGGRGYAVARREVVYAGRDSTQCYSPWSQTDSWTNLDSYEAKIEAWRDGTPSDTMTEIGNDRSGSCVLVTGLILREGPSISGELWPLEELPCTASDPQPRGNDYCVEFQNGAGEPIETSCFDVSWASEPLRTQVRHFAYSLPLPNGVGRVLLKAGEQVLAERVASDHAPSVQVISPNGGENWSTKETVAWTANDADEDTLSFTVLYSPDGGISWTPIATGIEETSMAVEASTLPGGENCIIKVEATDGVHTGVDTSDAPFMVPEHPPAITISMPLLDTVFWDGETIMLQGQAHDSEDGILSGDALTWFRDAEEVGKGETAEIGPLDRGLHEIRFEARDSDGNVATAYRTIMVDVEHLLLPLILRG